MARSTLVGSLVACSLFCAIALHVAGDQSATFDEVAHIGAGVAYLQGDLRLNNEHPPLAKVLAALALPHDEPTRRPPARLNAGSQWTFGADWLYRRAQAPLAILLRARTPIVLLCALLLPIVGLWTQALAGEFAACLAMGLLALCPLWIAHATLVTTDGLATLLFFSAAFSAWHLQNASGCRRVVIAGLLATSVALALATKYSMFALALLVPLASALDARCATPAASSRAALAWCAIAVGVGAGGGLLFAWGLPPDPGRYWHGVLSVGQNHNPGYEFYAFGRFFTGRDWSYFARALGVKVSWSVLALCALSPWLFAQQRRAATDSSTAIQARSAMLWLPPLGYFALMSAAAPPLGVRYVLPVLPFAMVLAGAAGSLLWRRRALRALVPVLVIVHVLGLSIALEATPLSFFNGVPCRTGDTLPCLEDSNVDWGQALPKLARFRDAHYPQTAIRIFYVGTSPPDAYVTGAQVAIPAEVFQPMRALYAVSLHRRVRMPKTAWPRQIEPSAVVGGAYAIYDLRQ